MTETNYYSKTYDSPNPLIRLAHRRRLQIALALVPMTPSTRLLDYGCGDGLFLRELARRHPGNTQLFGFEPFMSPLPGLPVQILQRWDAVEAKLNPNTPADIVTCFEVLEHFTPDKQAQALADMRHLLGDRGQAIISVPIECGFPSIPKNVLRWARTRHNRSNFYNWRDIGRSALAKPIPEHRSGSDYLSHMGFYYFDLERVFTKSFKIRQRSFSPFPALGAQLNSQVFYVLDPA